MMNSIHVESVISTFASLKGKEALGAFLIFPRREGGRELSRFCGGLATGGGTECFGPSGRPPGLARTPEALWPPDGLLPGS